MKPLGAWLIGDATSSCLPTFWELAQGPSHPWPLHVLPSTLPTTAYNGGLGMDMYTCHSSHRLLTLWWLDRAQLGGSSFLTFKNIFIYLAAPGLSCGMWYLVPWAEIELRPTSLGAQSLSHWATREVLPKRLLSTRCPYASTSHIPAKRLQCLFHHGLVGWTCGKRRYLSWVLWVWLGNSMYIQQLAGGDEAGSQWLALVWSWSMG